METYLDNIPFSQILIYLAIGLLLIVVSKFISAYVIPLLKGKQVSVSVSWQRVQIVIWLVFFGMFYTAMLHENRNLTIILTVVVTGLGWSYWRNIFSGILIKFYNQFNVGDEISTDFVIGKFKEINLDQSELINDKGESIVIPNYKLRTAVLKHLYEKDSVNTHPFTVKTAENKTQEEVYKMVLNCPYISTNQDIYVEKIADKEYMIRASIIDSSLSEKVNKYFQDIYKKEADKAVN
ncbi:MAG: mechanosensitive ion channel family protein [Bacteroidota bacterium]